MVQGVLPEGMIHLGNESTATWLAARRALANSQTVTVVGIGHSMEPRIPDRTRCIIAPLKDTDEIRKHDVVFCKIGVYFALHKVLKVAGNGRFIKIGNNHGGVDGWTTRRRVYGRYVGACK